MKQTTEIILSYQFRNFTVSTCRQYFTNEYASIY